MSRELRSRFGIASTASSEAIRHKSRVGRAFGISKKKYRDSRDSDPRKRREPLAVLEIIA